VKKCGVYACFAKIEFFQSAFFGGNILQFSDAWSAYLCAVARNSSVALLGCHLIYAGVQSRIDFIVARFSSDVVCVRQLVVFESCHNV